HLKNNHVHFQPAVNEELAATVIWGSQQLDLFPGARYDGVFGLWYGKGPGLDRAMDPMKHATNFGTSRHGGVLAVGGSAAGPKPGGSLRDAPGARAPATDRPRAGSVSRPAQIRSALCACHGIGKATTSSVSGVWMGWMVAQPRRWPVRCTDAAERGSQ